MGEGDSEGDSTQTTVRQREQAAAREAESYHQVDMARQKRKGRVGEKARTGDEGVRTRGPEGEGVSWHLGQETVARPDDMTPNCRLTL